MAIPRRKDQPEPGAGFRHAWRSGPARTVGRPPASRPATCKAISPFCRRHSPADFLRFCQLNPKPCPLIGTSAPGDPRVPELGEDLDIRTDLPRYRVWKNGELVAEPEDVREFWRDDLRQLRHRMLVFVRGGSGGGGHRTAPHHARLQRADVSHLDRYASRPGRFTGRWSCRCGR